MMITKLMVASCLLLPMAAYAASPFDGTWKADVAKEQPSKKPWNFMLKDGVYSCSDCSPPYSIKADGSDQMVAGHLGYDSLSASSADAQSISTVAKLKGKVVNTEKDTVSADGKTLTAENTDVSGANPVKETDILTRKGPAPAGAHAASGSWLMSKVASESDSGLTLTFAVTDDSFSFKLNGISADAKFDGKQYPVSGQPSTEPMTMTIKKVGATGLKADIYAGGKLRETFTYKVSADGKVLHSTGTDLRSHDTWHSVLYKTG